MQKQPHDPDAKMLAAMMLEFNRLTGQENHHEAISLGKEILEKADTSCANVGGSPLCDFLQLNMRVLLAAQYNLVGDHVSSVEIFRELNFDHTRDMFARNDGIIFGMVFDDILMAAAEAFYLVRNTDRCVELLSQIAHDSNHYAAAQHLLAKCQFSLATCLPKVQKAFGDIYDPFTEAGNVALKAGRKIEALQQYKNALPYLKQRCHNLPDNDKCVTRYTLAKIQIAQLSLDTGDNTQAAELFNCVNLDDVRPFDETMIMASTANLKYANQTCVANEASNFCAEYFHPIVWYLSRVKAPMKLAIKDQDQYDMLAQVALKILYGRDSKTDARHVPMFAHKTMLYLFRGHELANSQNYEAAKHYLRACIRVCEIEDMPTLEHKVSCENFVKQCEEQLQWVDQQINWLKHQKQQESYEPGFVDRILPGALCFYRGFFLAAVPDAVSYGVKKISGSKRAGDAGAFLLNLAMLAAMFSVDKDLIFTTVYFSCGPLLNSSSEQARSNGNLAVFLTPAVMAAPLPGQIAEQGLSSFVPMLSALMYAGISKLGSGSYAFLKYVGNLLYNESDYSKQTAPTTHTNTHRQLQM